MACTRVATHSKALFARHGLPYFHLYISWLRIILYYRFSILLNCSLIHDNKNVCKA